MTDALLSSLALLKDRMNQRDRLGINYAAFELIKQQAPLGAQWVAIATLLQHHGEHEASLRALAAWEATAGSQPRIRFEMTRTLARAGRLEEARQCIEELPADFPSPVDNAYLKGTIANNLGDSDAAVRALTRAVALDPGSGQSWLALSMAAPLDPAETNKLRAARASFLGVESADAAAYFYALGRFEDLQGDHEAAFAAFAHGARLMQQLQPFNATADRAVADAEIADWNQATVHEARSTVALGDARPIFVTGLPRSGTTLVEQILASHSSISGGAELSLFSIIGRDVGGLSYGALKAWRELGNDPQKLRTLYHYLADQRFPMPGRIVDKTLSTSRYMGLVATLFPDAPIIWLRRDPVDCAWSAFRNYFVNGVEWSWSLDSIADFFSQEDRLFEHWTGTLGDQILVVPYDELVSDPGPWTMQINDHVGLSLEVAQLAPERTVRAVLTNSTTQVREVIHQRGIGAAQPYRSKLDDFVNRYYATYETNKSGKSGLEV